MSFLDEKGRPSIVERCTILPPQSMMGIIDEERRKAEIMADGMYGKYDDAVDNESAYEILTAKNRQDAEAKAEAEQAAAEAKAKEQAEKEAAKAREKEEKEAAKAKEKQEKQKAASKKKTSTALGKAASSAATTIGRQVGNSLARGLLGTLKKWF